MRPPIATKTKLGKLTRDPGRDVVKMCRHVEPYMMMIVDLRGPNEQLPVVTVPYTRKLGRVTNVQLFWPTDEKRHRLWSATLTVKTMTQKGKPDGQTMYRHITPTQKANAPQWLRDMAHEHSP